MATEEDTLALRPCRCRQDTLLGGNLAYTVFMAALDLVVVDSWKLSFYSLCPSNLHTIQFIQQTVISLLSLLSVHYPILETRSVVLLLMLLLYCYCGVAPPFSLKQCGLETDWKLFVNN